MPSTKNPSKPIRFIYFDLDDTLLDHRAAERAALADLKALLPHVFAHVAIDELQATYHAINTALWQQYQQGAIDRATLLHHRFAQLIEALQLVDVTPEQLNTIYLAHYPRHWRWTQGAQKAFLTIAQHFPVGLLTNGFAPIQRAKLAHFPELSRHARCVIISEEVGVAKPHPELFNHAAAAAGLPPEALLYVGDSWHSDVQGAYRAGWQVAWYHPSEPTAAAAAGVFAFAHWPKLLRWLGLHGGSR